MPRRSYEPSGPNGKYAIRCGINLIVAHLTSPCHRAASPSRSLALGIWYIRPKNALRVDVTDSPLRDIRQQKLARLAGGARHGAGRDVPAAHRAFHGGGPAGAGPIAGQE